MRLYLNIRSWYGIETVDCIDTKAFKTKARFREEKKKLIACYRQLDGTKNAWWSSRATKGWYENHREETHEKNSKSNHN